VGTSVRMCFPLSMIVGTARRDPVTLHRSLTDQQQLRAG